MQPWSACGVWLDDDMPPVETDRPPAILLLEISFFFLLGLLAFAVSGNMETLIGVGCVLKTGISQSFNVLVSGIKKPLPIQINRSRSPPLVLGRSNESRVSRFKYIYRKKRKG